MEQKRGLDPVRGREFKKSVSKPKKVMDSRFGLRKLPQNSNERPSIAVWNTPGKGPNGESQN